jgi:hypothetical protein
LADASRSTGLALLAVTDTQSEVIPFDRPVRWYRSKHRSGISATGKAGKMIATYSRFSFESFAGELAIYSIDGELITKKAVSIPGFCPLALSETSGRLAFSATSTPPGLFWAPLDLNHITTVSDGMEQYNPDWSPDGQMITYEKGGEIFTFATENGVVHRLTQGHFPTWSPKKQYLAFVSPKGYASLITDVGTQVNWPLSSYRPITPIRWSPDGRFVSFAEASGWIQGLVDKTSYLKVFRVRDGEATVIRSFGSKSGDTALFQWISNYQKFCERCDNFEATITQPTRSKNLH